MAEQKHILIYLVTLPRHVRSIRIKPLVNMAYVRAYGGGLSAFAVAMTLTVLM